MRADEHLINVSPETHILVADPVLIDRPLNTTNRVHKRTYPFERYGAVTDLRAVFCAAEQEQAKEINFRAAALAAAGYATPPGTIHRHIHKWESGELLLEWQEGSPTVNASGAFYVPNQQNGDPRSRLEVLGPSLTKLGQAIHQYYPRAHQFLTTTLPWQDFTLDGKRMPAVTLFNGTHRINSTQRMMGPLLGLQIDDQGGVSPSRNHSVPGPRPARPNDAHLILLVQNAVQQAQRPSLDAAA